MGYAWRRSVQAMFLTSLTTAVAFLANMTIIIPVTLFALRTDMDSPSQSYIIIISNQSDTASDKDRLLHFAALSYTRTHTHTDKGTHTQRQADKGTHTGTYPRTYANCVVGSHCRHFTILYFSWEY